MRPKLAIGLVSVLTMVALVGPSNAQLPPFIGAGIGTVAICGPGFAQAVAVGLTPVNTTAETGGSGPNYNNGTGVAESTAVGTGNSSASAKSNYGLGTSSASCSWTTPGGPDPELCDLPMAGRAVGTQTEAGDLGTVAYLGNLYVSGSTGNAYFKGARATGDGSSAFAKGFSENRLIFTMDMQPDQDLPLDMAKPDCPPLAVTFYGGELLTQRYAVLNTGVA